MTVAPPVPFVPPVPLPPVPFVPPVPLPPAPPVEVMVGLAVKTGLAIWR